MKTKTVTAQNCSLFEIDAGLEEAFDQLQEEREITGNISEQNHGVLRQRGKMLAIRGQARTIETSGVGQ